MEIIQDQTKPNQTKPNHAKSWNWLIENWLDKMTPEVFAEHLAQSGLCEAVRQGGFAEMAHVHNQDRFALQLLAS